MLIQRLVGSERVVAERYSPVQHRHLPTSHIYFELHAPFLVAELSIFRFPSGTANQFFFCVKTAMGMEPDRYSEIQNHGLPDGLHRYDLQERYLTLTRHTLPAIARLNGWRLKEDHCFMRVILDQLFQDCWYNHLDRRLTAYKQLNNEQLRRAISLGTVIEGGDVGALEKWNRESLCWRNKPSDGQTAN